MVDIDVLDMKLYDSIKEKSGSEKLEDLWNQIRNDSQVLCEAIKVVKDPFNPTDNFRAPAVVECMLKDYENVDSDIYQRLISTIFENQDVARTLLFDGDCVGLSYLTRCLMNFNLALTPEQKNWVFCETLRANHTFNAGVYDLKYYILRNHSWSLEEKQNLILTFYGEREFYDSLIEWDFDSVCLVDQERGFSLSHCDDIVLDDPNAKLSSFLQEEDLSEEVKERLNFCSTMYRINNYRDGNKVYVKEDF